MVPVSSRALPVHARRRTPTVVAASAPANGHQADPRLRSITAASRRLDTGTVDPRALRREARSEQCVWDLMHVPEPNYALRFMANSMSRLRLFPAVVVDASEDPVPVDKAVEDPEIRLPAQIADQAIIETDRMTVGCGGQATLLSRFGSLLTAVGNSFVLVDDDAEGCERWEVLSRSNLMPSPTGNGLGVKRSQAGEPVPVGDDALLYRVWQGSPQWPDDPDSGMFSVLDALQELEIYDRQFRAVGRSRTPAGLLVFPSELDPGPRQRAHPGGYDDAPFPDPADQKPVDSWSDFELALLKSFITPQEDDGSAASVMPHLIKGRAELLDHIRHIPLDRTIDAEAIDRMNFLIRRVAHGVNLPVEVLLGLADSNHWNSWLISDETYRAHIEPTAQVPAAGLAREHLRPALAAAGHDMGWVDRIVYGIDPSQLVVRPNRTQDAKDAHDRVAISDAAYRHYLNFPESDAPDEEEQARRLAMRRGAVTPEMMAELLDRTGVVADPPLEVTGTQAQQDGTPELETPADEADDPVDGGDPLPATEPARALTAAAVELPGLGDRLATIEARLRDRLQVAGSDSLRRALQTAGNRLRTQVQQDPELRDEVNGQPAEEVGLILGQDRAPTTDTDVLLAGAFADLRPRWDEWVTQAEAEMADVTAARLGLDPADVQVETRHEQGWEALLLALTALAGAQVFTSPPTPRGEVDASVTVPATLVRDALAVAGGTETITAPTGTAAQAGPPGLLTGPLWLGLLAGLGVFPDRWEWQTGRPSQPFPPHQELDGLVFEAWDDPVLANFGTFPSHPFFFPSDHTGCVCQTVPSLVRLPQEIESPSEVTSS